VAPSLPAEQLPDSLRLQVTPIHYDLTVTIDYERAQLAAAAGITVRNWSDAPVGTVPLTLYRLMTIHSVRASGGDSLGVDQVVRAYDDFGQLQVLAATVRLATPLPPGDTTTIIVRYGGYLLGYAETGMRYVRDRIDVAFTIIRPDGQAYPQVAYPSWAANRRTPWPLFTYQAAITVPESLTVANGGRRVSRTVRDGQATFVYESLKPSSRMDFAIARYGRLAAGPVQVFYLPGDSAGAGGVLRAARAAMELFSGWFGQPPHGGGLTFLEIPDGWGSQADVTTIIQAAAAFRDSSRLHEVYHEVSHLWNPPDLDTPSPRWNEGLASFLERLATEELQGVPVRNQRAAQLLDWLRQSAPQHAAWGETALVDYGRAQLTDLSYSVGALFFELLYRLAGPAAVRRIIGEYSSRYASGGTTADLVELIRAEAGVPVDALLHDWILTPGWLARIRGAATIEDLAALYR